MSPTRGHFSFGVTLFDCLKSYSKFFQMRKFLPLLLASILMLECAFAQQKTKVVLLGCFHFENPGLDVAKFENANILSEKRQKEVREIVDKLKAFKPDKIFVEVPIESQLWLDSSFNSYKNGSLTLKGSETQQLGFRLAKELNHQKLYGVDYRDAQFPFDSLMKSATEAQQFNLLGSVKKIIDSVEKMFNESLKKSTIREMLLEQNTKEGNEFQVGMYYEFLIAGKEGNHVGSYLTSEWWRRNMVIYENILKRMSGKEEKILVIFGSGHTALLNEMMKYSKRLEVVPVATVL
jgi:uncharacterized protein DUF5694